MKIGFVLDDSLDRGDGVQQYILTLGTWLTGQGHQIHYLVGQTKRTDLANVHSLSNNFGVRFNGNRMTIPLPASKTPIKKLLTTEQFDVLHVQMPYSPFMAAKVIRYAPVNTRIFGTFHILPYRHLQDWGARLLSWWLRKPTAKMQQVWSVSQPAQVFAQKLKIDSTVLPNVVNYNLFHQPVVTQQSFKIVFLGRLVERKGCLELLKAFELAQLAMPNAQLIIGGGGEQADRLENWVTDHNLNGKVVFEGFIDEAAKPSFLAQASIAVFPSLGGESFGIVLLEAMAAGSAVVIGGNNPGYASVLAPVPNSLFNPRDSQALANLLVKLYKDKAFGQAINTTQKQMVKDYDVAVVGKKLLSYYQKELA